jgi:hypothetical protein
MYPSQEGLFSSESVFWQWGGPSLGAIGRSVLFVHEHDSPCHMTLLPPIASREFGGPGQVETGIQRYLSPGPHLRFPALVKQVGLVLKLQSVHAPLQSAPRPTTR